MGVLLYSTIALFIFVCLLLILLILIQKGRGGGLSSAFGGGGGGSTAFGAKTGDVLTWTTSIVFGVFLLLAIGLNLITNRLNARALAPVIVTPSGEVIQTEPQTPSIPPAGSVFPVSPQVPPAVGAPAVEPEVSAPEVSVPVESAPAVPSMLDTAPPTTQPQ